MRIDPDPDATAPSKSLKPWKIEVRRRAGPPPDTAAANERAMNRGAFRGLARRIGSRRGGGRLRLRRAARGLAVR
jgi:hypothetical protein